MYNPYRIAVEKPVIRKIELTEKEIRTAIAKFIKCKNLIDWECDEDKLNFYFKDKGVPSVGPISVIVQKEEKIPGVKY